MAEELSSVQHQKLPYLAWNGQLVRNNIICSTGLGPFWDLGWGCTQVCQHMAPARAGVLAHGQGVMLWAPRWGWQGH